MPSEESINEVISLLKDLLEDAAIPKNVKVKIQEVIDSLEEKSELSIKINKSLNYLDEIGNDANLQPYTRTQIWNIVSILEHI